MDTDTLDETGSWCGPSGQQRRSAAATAAPPEGERKPRLPSTRSNAVRSSTTFAMRRACAHQADPPDAAGQRTEPGADFDAVVVEQTPADAASSTPSGTRTAFSVQSRSPGRRQQRETQRVETRHQGKMVALVALPTCVEPFFVDDGERLAQRINQRRRNRVVIPPAHPVVLEQREIEIEAPRGTRAARSREQKTRAVRDRTARRALSACSCSRRRAPNRAVRAGSAPSDVTASTTVSAPLRAASCKISCTGFSTPVDVSAWTTATMSAPLRGERALDRRGIARASPLDFKARDARTVALEHVREPIAKISSDDHSRAFPGAPGWRPPLPCLPCRCRKSPG